MATSLALAARILVAIPLAALGAVGAIGAAAEMNAPVDTGGLNSLSGYYLAARHAGRQRDLRAAADYYNSALLSDEDNPELLSQAVTLQVAAGDIEAAVIRSKELLERDHDNRLALTTLAVDAFQRGDDMGAHGYLKQLRDGGPLPEISGALIEAWLLADQGEMERAIEMLSTLDGPSWYDSFKPLHIGLIADYAGLHETAVNHLREAYESRATEFRVVTSFARGLARAGHREEAVQVLDDYQNAIGDKSRTEYLKTEIVTGQQIAPHVSNPRAGAAEALFELGSAIGNDGNLIESAGYMRLALRMDPQSPFAALSLGTTLTRLGQNEEAIKVFRGIDENTLVYPEATVQIAVNLNELEKVDEATSVLSARMQSHPDDIEAGLTLGNIFRSRDRFNEAADVYTTLIGQLGDVPEPYWSIYYYRGITYEQTDRWQLAEADFRKALELEPEQPLVLNYLGYSLIDRGEKLEEAVSMVEKAVEQRPEDGYIVDSLAWAYYRLGNYENAVKELERAVSLKPDDPVINDHLGDAYWQVGRKLEATFQWRHARDLEPSPEDLQKILAKLRDGLDTDDDGGERDAAAATPQPGAATAK